MISSNSNGAASHGDAQESSRADGQRSRSHSLARGVAVGLLLAILITFALVVIRMRHATPRLTEADYRAAVARWEKNGPADYDLDLELGGKRPGPIHVEVRGGEVTRMTRDGVEPRQKRTWDYWSVAGQLETIGQELEMARRPADSFGAPGASEVVMWAEFDSWYGYPRSYDRIVLGADLEVHWKVVEFTPVVKENRGP
jgi:hypothetical protein